MTETLLRGRTLTFPARPEAIDHLMAWRFEGEDGACRSGMYFTVAAYAGMLPRKAGRAKDRPPAVSAGAWIHRCSRAHFLMVSSYPMALNRWKWLNTYTFLKRRNFNAPARPPHHRAPVP